MAKETSPSDWSEAKRRQKDMDATHTKKHGKGYHGYKLSIGVDGRHKFIRKMTTGTASEHDNTHFDDVLHEHNTSAGEMRKPCSEGMNMLKKQANIGAVRSQGWTDNSGF